MNKISLVPGVKSKLMNSFLKKGDFGSGLTKNSSTLILRMSTMIKENLKENCPFLKEIM